MLKIKCQINHILQDEAVNHSLTNKYSVNYIVYYMYILLMLNIVLL